MTKARLKTFSSRGHRVLISAKRRDFQDDLSRVIMAATHALRVSPLPRHPQPMLCTLISEPFDDSNWIFEPKFDGQRILGRFKWKLRARWQDARLCRQSAHRFH